MENYNSKVDFAVKQAGSYTGSNKKGYYFHPDEDFREDWEWSKRESEALSVDFSVENKALSI